MISMIRMYADDTLVHTEHDEKQYYHHIQKWKMEKQFANVVQYIAICVCNICYSLNQFFFGFADSNTSNARLCSTSACKTSVIEISLRTAQMHEIMIVSK